MVRPVRCGVKSCSTAKWCSRARSSFWMAGLGFARPWTLGERASWWGLPAPLGLLVRPAPLAPKAPLARKVCPVKTAQPAPLARKVCPVKTAQPAPLGLLVRPAPLAPKAPLARKASRGRRASKVSRGRRALMVACQA